MGQCHATLRIFSEDKSVDELSTLMGREPTESSEKGQDSKYEGLKKIMAKRASWRLTSSLDRKHPLEEHLLELIHFLEPKKQLIHQMLDDGDRIDFFCFCGVEGQMGVELSPELLASAAGLRIPILLDLYS